MERKNTSNGHRRRIKQRVASNNNRIDSYLNERDNNIYWRVLPALRIIIFKMGTCAFEEKVPNRAKTMKVKRGNSKNNTFEKCMEERKLKEKI